MRYETSIEKIYLEAEVKLIGNCVVMLVISIPTAIPSIHLRILVLASQP